jgi:hypothetical protein
MVTMTGSVQTAILTAIPPGTQLPTPTGRAQFVVSEHASHGLIILLGPKRTSTTLSWQCLEGIPVFLRGRDWIRVGANRDVNNRDLTLDGYLKGCVKRQTADYVAVVLQRAGIVELDPAVPARVRLLGT